MQRYNFISKNMYVSDRIFYFFTLTQRKKQNKTGNIRVNIKIPANFRLQGNKLFGCPQGLEPWTFRTTI